MTEHERAQAQSPAGQPEDPTPQLGDAELSEEDLDQVAGGKMLHDTATSVIR